MGYVLVIDDCIVHQEMLIQGLASEGVPCIGAVNIKDAVHLVDESLPELIILDPLAASQQAYLFFQQLQNNPMTCHIPVVLLTSASKRDLKRYSQVQRGRVDCLNKPCDIQDILSRVYQYV